MRSSESRGPVARGVRAWPPLVMCLPHCPRRSPAGHSTKPESPVQTARTIKHLNSISDIRSAIISKKELSRGTHSGSR